MEDRLPLQAALAAPERVRRLVLVSSTPGIEDRAARAARRADDERLASELEAGTLAEFVARWRAQPLFAGEPPRVSRLVQEDQLRNRADALAAVLRGVGTGAMPPLWEGLGELEMPVTVLAGDRDAKFLEIARRMVERLPDAELLVAAGGHRLHLENPAAVSRAITARP